MRALKWWAGTAIGVALLALLIDQPLLLVLALLLGLAAASAWCWWRFGLSEVSFERHLSAERAAFGEEIEIELAIENAKPLPLVWLDVQDEFPEELPVLGATIEPNEKSRRVTFHTVFSAGPYERVRRRYRISCAKRGLFSFGPATLQTGDPFGFSRRADLIPDSATGRGPLFGRGDSPLPARRSSAPDRLARLCPDRRDANETLRAARLALAGDLSRHQHL